MNNEEFWKAALAEIELNVSRASFITWFRNTYVASKKEGEVVVNVPNTFSKEWLENKFNKLILKTLRGLSPEVKEVSFVIDNKRQTPLKNKKQRKAPPINISEDQLSFESFAIDKETNLNPKYIFENFIVGASNELAHATAVAVSQKPGKEYNPLFIYGGVGLGKTHLLQAVGNTAKEKNKSKKVQYLTCEKFTNEFIYAAHNQKIKDFREKYRKIDLLIIDDIQFIAKKERTQEEFFHTFNTLHENNKQIILSSDRPPKSINYIEERLRSRFEGGMLADIGYPDLEMRIAILKTKAKERGVELPQTITQYIAENVQSNIRELEGCLNVLLNSLKINNTEINLENTKRYLGHIIKRPRKIINLKKMLKIISEFYDVSEKDVLSQNRKREVSHPRQVLMYLMREELKQSYPLIGSRLGGRDHTTVIHACSKISEALRGNNEIIAEEINLLKQEIYNS